MSILTAPVGVIKTALRQTFGIEIKHTQVLSILAPLLGYRVHSDLTEIESVLQSCIEPCLVLQPHMAAKNIRQFLNISHDTGDVRAEQAFNLIFAALAANSGLKVFRTDGDFLGWFADNRLLNTVSYTRAFADAQAACPLPCVVYQEAPDWIEDSPPLLECRKHPVWPYQYTGEAYAALPNGAPDTRGCYILMTSNMSFARVGGGTVIDLGQSFPTAVSTSANQYHASMGGIRLSGTFRS